MTAEDRARVCAICARRIPDQYLATAVVTASGPAHPGCWRKITNRQPVNPWESSAPPWQATR